MNNHIYNSLFVKPINQKGLVEVINSLKVKSVSGGDNIKNLKVQLFISDKTLLHLINFIHEKGIYSII